MTSQNPEPVELTSVTLKTVVDLQSVRVKDEHSNLDKTRKKVLRQRRQKLHHLDKNSGRAHMFGITCNFGTDDFFFMPLIGAALRATW